MRRAFLIVLTLEVVCILAQRFKVGDRVAGNHQGHGKFYAAKITAITQGPPVVYHLKYEMDGVVEDLRDEHVRGLRGNVVQADSQKTLQVAANQPAVLQVNDVVMGLWEKPGQTGWYKGKIAKVYVDRTYRLHFDDGDKLDKMPRGKIKLLLEIDKATAQQAQQTQGTATQQAVPVPRTQGRANPAAQGASPPVRQSTLPADVDPGATLERLGKILAAPEGTHTPEELAQASREARQLRAILKKRKEQSSGPTAGESAALEAQAAQLAGELQALNPEQEAAQPAPDGAAPDGAAPDATAAPASQGVAALQRMAEGLRAKGDKKKLAMIEKLLQQLQKLTEQGGAVLNAEIGEDMDGEFQLAVDTMELDPEATAALLEAAEQGVPDELPEGLANQLDATIAAASEEVKPLKKGDRVEGNWMRAGKWYPGKIHKVNADKTYLVHFDDGDIEDNMEEVRVRRPGGADGAPQQMVMMVMGPNGEWQTVQGAVGQGSGQMADLLAQLQGAAQAGQAGQRARPHASSAPASGGVDSEEFMPSPKQSVVSWNTQHWKNF